MKANEKMPGPEFIENNSNGLKEEDVKKAASATDRLVEKIKNTERLAGFIVEILLLASLIKDYVKGNYRSIPYKSIAAIAFTILYVLNIMDLIPDVIPGLGLVDDATMIGMLVRMVGNDLEKYKEWRTEPPVG